MWLTAITEINTILVYRMESRYWATSAVAVAILLRRFGCNRIISECSRWLAPNKNSNYLVKVNVGISVIFVIYACAASASMGTKWHRWCPGTHEDATTTITRAHRRTFHTHNHRHTLSIKQITNTKMPISYL